MRGEVCVGSASFLSFAAVLLLIFAHLGQINTSTIPRGLAFVKVNVSDYGKGLAGAFNDPIDNLYTFNASAPLGTEAGLRQSYEFGLYSYCAYVDTKLGTCSNHTVANRYKLYDVITSDMLPNYTRFTDAIIPESLAFRDDSYLSSASKAAYYMLLLGSICAALAFFAGLSKHTVTFLLSAVLSILGSLLLLIGAAIWTVMINKTESINNISIPSSTVPLGIEISVGPGLFLVWAAFACLVVSVVPYMISCCTFRG